MDKKEAIMNDLKKAVDSSKSQDKKKETTPIFTKFKTPIIIAVIVVIVIILILLFGGSSKTLSVFVADEENRALKDVNVTIVSGNNEETLKTDVFGQADFTEIKARKVNLVVSKDNYITADKEITLSKNSEETVILMIDTSKFEFSGSTAERRREIIFKSFDVVVTDSLDVSFKCSTGLEIPEPRTVTVTTGRQNVVQPKNCGSLLVSVTSANYDIITDRNVPENNIVDLGRNLNTGILEITVKGITGQGIPLANIKIHNLDNPLTPINESEPTVVSNQSDMYGKYKFNLAQSDYLVSVDKVGYLTMPKSGPYTVVNGSTLSKEIMIFTTSDLENINCSNAIYAPFCKNGVLDCNSSLLTGLVTPNANGTGCIVGRLANLTIKLKDQNSSAPVTGNISLYKRDQNTSTLVGTRTDINQTTFNVLSGKNYRIIVSNTEDNGYIPSAPRDINALADGNVTVDIPLEYSSSINSGKINVNVSKDGYNRANAFVYLFYELNDEYVLYNPENPKLTDLHGDANFTSIRSNRDYYAYAILRNENADGDSLPAEDLDSNDTLELEVNLNNQSKMLNLKINPSQDYNYTFYDVTGDEIESNDIISTNVTGDINKTFVFNCDNCSRVYMIIKKNDITYQTDLINLLSNQTVYKEITFPTSLSAVQTSTEYLGIFDATGTNKITRIGFIGDNDITKEYKLKFKTTFGQTNTNVIKKSFIRAGQYLDEGSDYLYLTNTNLFLAEDVELRYGCRYRGDLADWNNTYFNANFNSDNSFNGCTAGKYKWAEFDFEDINANVIEYSINLKFKNEITNTDNYKIFYRSINSNLDTFAFSPANTTWQNWTIRPNGYFYAPTQSQTIPFESTPHSYILTLSDSNGPLTKFGSDYILYIDRDYNYTIYFAQFGDNNRTGDIVTSTNNSNDNYVFTRSYFKDRNSSTQTVVTMDNNLTVTIPQKTTNRGYYFTNSLIGKPIDFFSLTGTPTIKTQLFKSGNSILETTSTSVLSYSQNEYAAIIKSQATDGKIYIGSNDLNISLKNRTGNFQNDIDVSYKITGDTAPTPLGQITNNTIQRQIFIPDTDSGKTITFTFTIPNSNLPNNELEYSQVITSGIEVYNLDSEPITNINKLPFTVIITTINGVKKASEPIKDYIIKNRTNRTARLDSISVSDNDAFMSELIDGNLTQNNSLPIANIGSEKTIFAGVIINPNITVNDINFSYNNTLTLQNTGSNAPTTLHKDTNSSLTIKRINITDTSKFTTPLGNGYYKDETGSTLELITDISPEVSLVYDLNLAFDNTTLDYNVLDITIDGNNISELIGFTETHNINKTTTGLRGNLNLTFSLLNNSIEEITDKDLKIKVKIGKATDEFIYEIPIKAIAYPKNKSYELTTTQGNIVIIPCKDATECNSEKRYIFTNNTKSYSMSLSDAQISEIAPLSFTVTTPVSITTSGVSVPVTIDGNFTNLMATGQSYLNYNKNLIFDLTVNNNVMQELKRLDIRVTYYPEDAQTAISDSGFTGEFCLGVGGDITNEGDYFILGSCKSEENQEACKSGETSLPKIIYNWGQTTAVNWGDLCIDTNEGYDVNKTHCDSVQALYSIFTLIGDPTRYEPEDNNYYFYLMSDGVSQDLLYDFRTSYRQVLTDDIDEDFHNAYLSADYEHSLEITKTNANGEATRKVGKYKLIVLDYDPNFDNDLTINLQLVQNIPLDKDNLFYYIPIDGEMGLQDNNTVHRVGYGSTIVGDYDYPEPINMITSQNSQSVSLYKSASCPNVPEGCSGVTEITANYPTNYLVDWQVTDVLESNGLLLDLSVDNSNNNKTKITFNFTPSRPIHVFAKVSDIQNTNFNYQLKYADDTAFSWEMSIFKWKDYNDDDYTNPIIDSPVIGMYYIYSRHTLTRAKFMQKYDTSALANNYLLESKIYLPVNPDYDQVTLSLNGLDNNQNSKLYGLNNVSGSNELSIQSIVQDNIYSITDLLNQVKTGNACISKSLTTTKIRWVDDKTSLHQGTIDSIKQNYSGSN